MTKHAELLIVVLLWTVLSFLLQVDAGQSSQTWVNNLSSKGVTVTITYESFGRPGFTNRQLAPGQAGEPHFDEVQPGLPSVSHAVDCSLLFIPMKSYTCAQSSVCSHLIELRYDVCK
jgi:hypothetical protein